MIISWLLPFPVKSQLMNIPAWAICFLKGQTYYCMFKFAVTNSSFPGSKMMKWQ